MSRSRHVEVLGKRDMSMRSMTGFGRGKAALGKGYVVLEIRTVNHRFLEIRTRATRELLAGEAMVEQLLRKRLSRGYCLVNLWYEGSLGGSVAIDQGALKSHLDALVEVAADKKLCLTDLIPVLTGAPDIFAAPRIEEEKALKEAIEAAFVEAVSSLVAMRESEGEAMSSELCALSKGLGAHVKTLAELSAAWPRIALSRLKERLQTLMSDGDIALDSGRMEAEVAILAERADVSEELTRIESHLDQLGTTIASDEPIGRKIEFLIQEMSREANTIASKTAIAEVSTTIIDIKSDLEKMRELAQNIE
jgi:uncharacterized protein (TIGR00255 family)